MTLKAAFLVKKVTFIILIIIGFSFYSHASIQDEEDKVSLSDSTSYSYFTNKLLIEKEYDLLYSIINDNYTKHWSINLVLIKELLKTDIKENSPKLWGNLKIIEGNIWNSIDDRNSAYQCYKEANIIFEEIGDEKGKALVLLNIAHAVDEVTTDISHSSEMLNMAANIFKDELDSVNTFKSYNNLAVQFLNRKRTDSVLYYLDKASTFLPAEDSDILKASILLNRGEYFMLLDSIELSNKCYFKANALLEKSEHHDALAFSYSQLGTNASETYPELAIEMFEKSLIHSVKANEKYIKLSVYENLGNVYLQIKDYENSANYLLKAIELNKYLKSTELEEKDELLKLHLDLNDKLKHISTLNIEKEILKRNTRAITIVSIILIGMSILIIILLRGQIQKKKILIKQAHDLSESNQLLMQTKLENEKLQKELIEEELKNKSNQVSSFAMQLVKKNEFMQRLQKEIVKLRKKVKNDTTLNEIQRIILEINQNIDSENNLLEFSMQVNKANQEFYAILEQHYPNLTKTEKQILGFLKINMTSKEIASVLNISLQGVNTKRYRLRTKLGLDNTVSFEDFFVDLMK